MKKKNINIIFFRAEILFHIVCIIFFIILLNYNVAIEIANIIYIIYIFSVFGYLAVVDIFLKKYDNAVHYKMFNKYFKPAQSVTRRKTYKREGVGSVIILWITYLTCIGLLKRSGGLCWQIFLIGASVVFIFNSIFTREVCLLSVFFLKNKNHCCKNCGINCWDYAIFASALIFSPQLSIVATVLNIVIIAVSIVTFALWEYNYYRYPERFYPESNERLHCEYCLKQCQYRETF